MHLDVRGCKHQVTSRGREGDFSCSLREIRFNFNVICHHRDVRGAEGDVRPVVQRTDQYFSQRIGCQVAQDLNASANEEVSVSIQGQAAAAGRDDVV